MSLGVPSKQRIRRRFWKRALLNCVKPAWIRAAWTVKHRCVCGHSPKFSGLKRPNVHSVKSIQLRATRAIKHFHSFQKAHFAVGKLKLTEVNFLTKLKEVTLIIKENEYRTLLRTIVSDLRKLFKFEFTTLQSLKSKSLRLLAKHTVLQAHQWAITIWSSRSTLADLKILASLSKAI